MVRRNVGGATPLSVMVYFWARFYWFSNLYCGRHPKKECFLSDIDKAWMFCCHQETVPKTAKNFMDVKVKVFLLHLFKIILVRHPGKRLWHHQLRQLLWSLLHLQLCRCRQLCRLNYIYSNWSSRFGDEKLYIWLWDLERWSHELNHGRAIFFKFQKLFL